ncbi:MAG: BolA/IbaG family iron-sulfur metabolism protein [Moraxellaceae bacterium]|jgi:acid stress-induced BolA-like protein IbaG/YrbA|nr:BolA/IbaG family iron-sulfur metabolism protein [Moraxellaceae bacterium]MBP8851597.1 BolA/IbaG family iron-sulfur metabolism protein [Moraxellaceae bacterium]MBP9045333.1 BolA/IbaG family iron-sulfur metabolism protein [Moraxellaceae bacterium]MBP9730007.1 BolA/IbaG family iron-sulfur metabolism protein [Moraxellaceae bacterium]MCC6199402.1 BolA/IbaG family iron-sulfur metabolism protein [Moraxellaceae bacterium]
MMIDLIKTLLELAIPDAEVLVEGGSGKYTVTVVTDRFEGMRPVAKQQLVYGPLNSHIATGEIHAVTMRTLTKEEWRKIKLFS